MNTKTELKWLVVFGVAATLMVGFLNGFAFKPLEIQFHDTYFVINLLPGIFYTAITLYTLKNVYLIVELFINRYRIIAVFIAIVNLPVALLLTILLGLAIQTTLAFGDTYPEADLSSRVAAIVVIAIIGLFLLVVEIKAVRSALNLLRGEAL